MSLILTAFLCFTFIVLKFSPQRMRRGVFFKNPSVRLCRRQAKAKWVKRVIVKIAAQNLEFGCRKIAFEFNRAYGHQETVSKSFVAGLSRLRSTSL
jgi:hypothetical protein